MTEKEYDPFEAWGTEVPPNLEEMAGSIRVDGVANPQMLEELAKDYLKKNLAVVRGARRLKQDIVALASCYGREILIGVGVASAVTAATASAVVIFRRRRRKGSGVQP